jgi:uncharacterized peroxidase-related enzyme
MMRLNKVAHGQSIPRKLMQGLMQLVTGMPTVDVMRTLTYRPTFFGKPYSAWLHEVMRGPSAWSVGERELFAAFTSRKNKCQFCTSGHTAVSVMALDDPDLVAAVLDDWQTAPVSPGVKATLAFLEKLTLEPEGITCADAERVRAAGVSRQGIAEAIHVCALFNIINRLADAFDFDLIADADPDVLTKGTGMLLKHGYKI